MFQPDNLVVPLPTKTSQEVEMKFNDPMETSMATQMAQAKRETGQFENLDIVVKWQKKMDEMNRENQALHAEVSLLRHENYFLGIGLDELKDENQCLKSKLQEAQSTIIASQSKSTTDDANTTLLKTQLTKTDEKYQSCKKQVTEWWSKFNTLAIDYNRLVDDSNHLKRKYRQKKAQLKALIQAAQYMIANETLSTVQQAGSSSPSSEGETEAGEYDRFEWERDRYEGKVQSRFFDYGYGYGQGRSQEERFLYSPPQRRNVTALEVTKIAPLQVRKGKWDFENEF